MKNIVKAAVIFAKTFAAKVPLPRVDLPVEIVKTVDSKNKNIIDSESP